MASKRLEQETTFALQEENTQPDLWEVATLVCSAGGCEFFWPVEDEEGDDIPHPKFCPCCGRRSME